MNVTVWGHGAWRSTRTLASDQTVYAWMVYGCNDTVRLKSKLRGTFQVKTLIPHGTDHLLGPAIFSVPMRLVQEENNAAIFRVVTRLPRRLPQGTLILAYLVYPGASTRRLDEQHLVVTSRPTGQALVVGGIQPCTGLPPRMVKNLPRYAAGTVFVLKGRLLRTKHGGLTFPRQVVAHQTVGVNRTYRFDLAPGRYVLVAHLPYSNVSPFVQVDAQRAGTVHVDIPNMCM